jgi:Xaa-Pro dipeptidase
MAGLNATELAGRLQREQQAMWLHLEAGAPFEKYPAKQHARGVSHLLFEQFGVSNGLIYLPGAVARNNEDSDMPAPFRQRRYFYYMSGCNEANCHVTYDIQNDKLTLFIPKIDPARVIWNGRGSTPAEALNKYDIDAVFYEDTSKEFIAKWLNHYRGNLYILHPSQKPLERTRSLIDCTFLRVAMDLAREIKDEHEVTLIRKANDISSKAHKEVLANILRLKNEAEVEGLFLNVCISQQAKQQAYDPIAASGPNAGTLHYDSNNEDFGDRQLMCLDAGCEYQLYASDITRTFPLSADWPTDESRNIYRLVERMQEACIAGLKPGVRFLDLHILAHHIAIDGLLSLGILHNGTREEIFKAGTSRAFFPHGLGHHVGLEVHDVGHARLVTAAEGQRPVYEKASSIYPENFHVPVYDAELCRAPVHPHSRGLQEGMVVTVEPGIYFSKYALKMFYLPSPIHSKYINTSVLKDYLPVGGVRIEDDILITSQGYENLTTAPKGDAMLEFIRKQKADLEGLSVQNANAKREAPLRRAPGVPQHMSDPVPRTLERAATSPAEGISHRRSVDLDPYEGSSLFSNFQRASTMDLTDRTKNITLSGGSKNDPSGPAPKRVDSNRSSESSASRIATSPKFQDNSANVPHSLYGAYEFPRVYGFPTHTSGTGHNGHGIDTIPGCSSRVAVPPSNHSTQDHQMQLMLLEQQNKKRLLMAQQEEEQRQYHQGQEHQAQITEVQNMFQEPMQSRSAQEQTSQFPEQHYSNHALQDYQMQLLLLEQQNKKRLLLAANEQDRQAQSGEAPNMSQQSMQNGPNQVPTNEALK